MTTHLPPLRALVALSGAVALSGCWGFVCTAELRPTLILEVRERATGMPAARWATGLSEHESGVLTEFFAYSELRLSGNWARELPGDHTIVVRKPGFLTEVAEVDVDADRCHVETEIVRVELARDPRAVPVSPVSFVEGPDTADWRPASVAVRVHGDTLEVRGYAGTDCTELQVVAFRSGSGLHVQVEPSATQLDSCRGSRWFEARFILPSEATHLLVTNAFLPPAELFSGVVRPARPD